MIKVQNKFSASNGWTVKRYPYFATVRRIDQPRNGLPATTAGQRADPAAQPAVEQLRPVRQQDLVLEGIQQIGLLAEGRHRGKVPKIDRIDFQPVYPATPVLEIGQLEPELGKLVRQFKQQIGMRADQFRKQFTRWQGIGKRAEAAHFDQPSREVRVINHFPGNEPASGGVIAPREHAQLVFSPIAHILDWFGCAIPLLRPVPSTVGCLFLFRFRRFSRPPRARREAPAAKVEVCPFHE